MSQRAHDRTSSRRYRANDQRQERATRSRCSVVEHRRRVVILGIALTGLITLLPWSAAAELKPAIQADLYLVQTEEYMNQKNYAAAQEAMGKILELQEEHGLTLPDEFHFKYAQVLERARSYAEAIAALHDYLEIAGQSGTHYREALSLLHKASQAEAAEDDEEYARAQSTGTASAYGEYLETNPSGRHVDEARTLLAEAEAADDAAYERAKKAGTVAAYGEYLSTYPRGRHAEEARRLQEEAEPREDDASYERAQKAGTAAAYGEYLRTYPSGRHAEEARRLQDLLRAGRRFNDCESCPEMVVVPAASYLMGSPSSEGRRDDDEGPQHQVTISEAFAVGVYEVTFEEWDFCVSRGGCGGYRPPDGWNWGRGRRPVMDISWGDAQKYVEWLRRETGEPYRLLSEAEWEYVARAGTSTPFHTGGTISTDEANYDGNWTYGNGREGVYRDRTVPVGSFRANAFGLHDVHGNVREWTQDCWNESYEGAPSDGSAWERGDCSRRVLRGGSWFSGPWNLRSAFRYGYVPRYRSDGDGFRVARTLTS